MSGLKEIRIVLDSPPGPDSGQFVELENGSGQSIKAGEWVQNGKFWELRIQLDPGSPEERIAALTQELGEPVMRVSTYCKAISTWMKVFRKKLREEADSLGRDTVGRQSRLAEISALRTIETNIRKSGLLARLIYAGENLRTRKCPIHKGKMDPEMWALRPGECECQGSGWLKEPEDGGPPKEATDEA